MQCFVKSKYIKVEISMIKIGELLRKLWSLRSCFLILPPGALAPQGIKCAMKRDVSKHWYTLQWCASRGWVIAHENWTSCWSWTQEDPPWGLETHFCQVPWAVVGRAHLIQEAHQCAKDTVQGCSQPQSSGCSFKFGRRSRHTSDAVPGHCSLQGGLRLNCVWLSISTDLRQLDTIHNSGLRLALGAFCTSPVPSAIHRGQRSSVGGTPVKAVHALLSENSCLH